MKFIISLLIVCLHFTAYSCNDSRSQAPYAIVPWLDQDGKACYYRNYKNHEMEEGQKLTEGFIWFKNEENPFTQKLSSTIYLKFLSKDEPEKWISGWGYIEGKFPNYYAQYGECDTAYKFDFSAKKYGNESVYLKSYWIAQPFMEYKTHKNAALRFDRIDNSLCQKAMDN